MVTGVLREHRLQRRADRVQQAGLLKVLGVERIATQKRTIRVRVQVDDVEAALGDIPFFNNKWGMPLRNPLGSSTAKAAVGAGKQVVVPLTHSSELASSQPLRRPGARLRTGLTQLEL